MYEELVKRLRSAESNYQETLDCLSEAADAIEELMRRCEQFQYMPPPAWIPVTERLPKDQRPVLVYVPPYIDGEEEYVGYVGMAYFTYSPNGGFWCGTDGNIYGAIGIIHEPLTWMPFPEPPKEESNGV